MTYKFFQQTCDNVNYFGGGAVFGIEIKDLPHYQFAKSYLSGSPDSSQYEAYLMHSWNHPDRDRINEQVKYFEKLISNLHHYGQNTPVKVIDQGDHFLLMDGNHRTSALVAMDRAVHHRIISIDEWVNTTFVGGNRYARNNDGLYQTIEIDKVYQGRRNNDIWNFIDLSDVAGKFVIDLGCNIGANSYWAARHGATVLGVDNDPNLLAFALRLNNFYLLDNVMFDVCNLNTILCNQADTMFCFSVDAHVDIESLIETFSYAKVVYLECHEGQRSELLDVFPNNELLGHTENNAKDRVKNRAVYRIEI